MTSRLCLRDISVAVSAFVIMVAMHEASRNSFVPHDLATILEWTHLLGAVW